MAEEILDSALQDEQRSITYKWLSRRLDVKTNEAKRILENYKSSHAEMQGIYYLSGVSKEGERTFLLVPEIQLEEAKSKFEKVTGTHLFSLSKNLPKDLTGLWSSDVEFYREPNRLSLKFSQIAFEGVKITPRLVRQPTVPESSKENRAPDGNKKETEKESKIEKSKSSPMLSFFGKQASNPKAKKSNSSSSDKSPQKQIADDDEEDAFNVSPKKKRKVVFDSSSEDEKDDMVSAIEKQELAEAMEVDEPEIKSASKKDKDKDHEKEKEREKDKAPKIETKSPSGNKATTPTANKTSKSQQGLAAFFATKDDSKGKMEVKGKEEIKKEESRKDEPKKEEKSKKEAESKKEKSTKEKEEKEETLQPTPPDSPIANMSEDEEDSGEKQKLLDGLFGEEEEEDTKETREKSVEKTEKNEGKEETDKVKPEMTTAIIRKKVVKKKTYMNEKGYIVTEEVTEWENVEVEVPKETPKPEIKKPVFIPNPANAKKKGKPTVKKSKKHSDSDDNHSEKEDDEKQQDSYGEEEQPDEEDEEGEKKKRKPKKKKVTSDDEEDEDEEDSGGEGKRGKKTTAKANPKPKPKPKPKKSEKTEKSDKGDKSDKGEKASALKKSTSLPSNQKTMMSFFQKNN